MNDEPKIDRIFNRFNFYLKKYKYDFNIDIHKDSILPKHPTRLLMKLFYAFSLSYFRKEQTCI